MIDGNVSHAIDMEISNQGCGNMLENMGLDVPIPRHCEIVILYVPSDYYLEWYTSMIFRPEIHIDSDLCSRMLWGYQPLCHNRVSIKIAFGHATDNRRDISGPLGMIGLEIAWPCHNMSKELIMIVHS